MGKNTEDMFRPQQDIKYLVISDIHFGKRSVPARDLVHQLTVFFHDFRDDSPLNEIDILFIAGDMFDQALSFSVDEVYLVMEFLRKIMVWCVKNNIKLRILEGTPSHDRGQPRNLIPMAKAMVELDFAYVPTMCVEHFRDLDITCLYVPDEFAGSAAKAQELIQEELNRLGLEKVTIAIMHGMFRYQLPEVTSERYKYDEQFFLDRVATYINIGHVHIPSVYKRILCQGSTGRLAHGEEHPKGGYLIHLNQNGEHQHYFLENREATTFMTVKITFNDVEKASQQLSKKIQGLRDFSHVRVKAERGHAIFNVLDHFKKNYPTYTFTKLDSKEEDTSKLVDESLLTTDYTPINIHRDNIVDMVMSRVKEKHSLQGNQLSRLEQKLLELR